MSIVDLDVVRMRRAAADREAERQREVIARMIGWVTQRAITAAEGAFRVAGHLGPEDADAARDVYRGARRRLLAWVRQVFGRMHPDVKQANLDLAATTYEVRLQELADALARSRHTPEDRS